MTSEEITFREPNFDDENHKDSALENSKTEEEAREHVVFQQPNLDGEEKIERPLPEDAIGGTDIAPTTTTHDASMDTQMNGNALALDDAPESEKRLDSQAKDETITHDPSLALAPTESLTAGESHRVVKKRTYLHKSGIMNSSRIRRHTFLAKCLGVLQNIWTMVSTFPYWDMAFWSG